MEKIPGILIRVGLVLLVFGFFKDTTVDTPFGAVHNIGLVKESQSLMLFGAIMLIGGLVLRSSLKNEQVTDANDKVKQEEPSSVKVETKDSIQTEVRQESLRKVPRINWSAPLDQLNKFRDQFFLRLTCGLVAGLLLTYIYGLIFLLMGLILEIELSFVYKVSLVVFGFFLFPLMLLLAYRKQPAALALKNLFFAAGLLGTPSLMLTLWAIFDGAYAYTLSIFSLPFIALGYFYFNWLSKK